MLTVTTPAVTEEEAAVGVGVSHVDGNRINTKRRSLGHNHECAGVTGKTTAKSFSFNPMTQD